MPWGKFRGQLLSEVESSYLVWCLERADALTLDLHDAIVAELGRRFSPPPSSPMPTRRQPCPDPVLATDLIGAGFKVLAKKAHPDAGGDTRQMQNVNAVADWLRGVVSR